MNLSSKLEIVNISNTGMKRPHNEDSSVSDAITGVVAVADGMGGYKAGEVASAITVKVISSQVCPRLKKGTVASGDGMSGEAALLKQSIVDANRHIYQTAHKIPECQGMGTTVVSAVFHDNKISVAHVGDSRLYRLRGEVFEQITSDHSLIQELIDRGFFTREEAEANTPKNLVTRALGIEPDVVVDVCEEPVQTGDIYLLCSDGLNDMVKDEEIHLTLSKYSANLVEAADELVAQANEKGGKDNISVILVRSKESFPAQNGFLGRITDMFKR